MLFIASGEIPAFNGRATSASSSDMGMERACAAVACSFIALAAWVRRLPFWLPNSCVVTEYLQSGHLNMLKPFISVMV